MMARLELGRIAGIPIFLDMMFVLIMLFFTLPYFTSGNSQMISAGIVIMIGLGLSVLLHELGHAFMGRLFNAHVSHIDLVALGGIAHFERSLPPSVVARSLIFLAGPAVNFILWKALEAGLSWAMASDNVMLAVPLGSLASANYYLMIFNLLPAYPLDGGHTLDALLGKPLGSRSAIRMVSILGVGVAAFIAMRALPGLNLWGLMLAFFLFQANWGALQSVR